MEALHVTKQSLENKYHPSLIPPVQPPSTTLSRLVVNYATIDTRPVYILYFLLYVA